MVESKKVKECKIAEAVTCNANATVVEVARLIRDKISRYVLVLDEEGFPIGIISTVDMNNKIIAEEKDAKDMVAKDIMSSPIETVDGEEELEQAYLRMVTKGKLMIPVVEEKKIKGVLTLNEAVAVLSHLMQSLSSDEAAEMERRLSKNG